MGPSFDTSTVLSRESHLCVWVVLRDQNKDEKRTEQEIGAMSVFVCLAVWSGQEHESFIHLATHSSIEWTLDGFIGLPLGVQTQNLITVHMRTVFPPTEWLTGCQSVGKHHLLFNWEWKGYGCTQIMSRPIGCSSKGLEIDLGVLIWLIMTKWLIFPPLSPSLIAVKIGIFYTIFYGVLAALVGICMWVFFQTLDPRIPKWKMSKSLIGTNPGENLLIILFQSRFPDMKSDLSMWSLLQLRKC